MDRMSTLDAGFFFVEHENVPMHIQLTDGLADALTWPLRQLAGAPGFFRQQLGAPGELLGL